MEHESFVPIPPARLIQGLRSPGVFTTSLPGWQPDEGEDAAGAPHGRLRLRVGGSTITYRGTVEVTGAGPEFTVVAEGTEVRGTGTVKASAELTVAATAQPESGSTLTWQGSAQADGRLAAYEEAVVEAAVRRLLDRFAAELGAHAHSGGPGAHAAAAPEPAPEADVVPRRKPQAQAGELEAAAESDADVVSRREPEAVPEAEADADVAPRREPEAGPEPGADADVDVVPQREPEAAPEAEADADAELESAPTPVADPEPEAPADPEPEAPADPEPEPPADPVAALDDSDTGEEPDVIDDLGEPVPAAGLEEFELVEVEVEVPESAAALDDLVPPAEAAHARRTMIGRSAEEVDHAPPRGRYAPVPAPDSSRAVATLRWAAPAAAALLASVVVVGRVLRRRR